MESRLRTCVELSLIEMRNKRSKMPKELHDKLKKEAEKKHLKGERKNAYIYGTLSKVKK